ncbi:unnamed protein product [Fraxinus pennsylvanica]|uniref:non-specific serine/threonine protein kinase n=1 Tax=Fraxinus pennsylvanica TaxID=56036 RepID=A0AAD2E5J6_9LAMI|nr:unnamed protein product [Fraxinus pennsylvanica]
MWFNINILFLITVFYVVQAENNAQILNDRASLVLFMSSIISDPKHALESWNSSDIHVCNWFGVKCDKNRNEFLELDLSQRSLHGNISPALSSLSSLEILDLSWNFFEGRIPTEIGSFIRLKQLSLSWNNLEGTVPSELGSLHQLIYLNLGSNRLTGEIPTSILCNGSSNLEYIDLSNNSLSGEIPLKNNQCGLRELKFLLLWSNQLVGEVPQALSNSSKLEWIDLESNFLSGELPSRIVNEMPHLQFLYLSYNNFSSHNGNTDLKPFFAALVNSTNLQELDLAGNNLGGELPSIIGSLSTSLVLINLDQNLLYGPIPQEISNLFNLTLLNLSRNFLGGSIPSELCQLGKLERLYLSNNSLSGHIPSAFGNISHLGLLDLSKNELSGSIPDSFAKLPQLRRLLLYENQLSGTIPTSLGQCVTLETLDVSHNRISGTIPGEVAGLSSLKLYLNLSSNHLQGPIPFELSKMDMVLAIDLSSNNLSSTIPSQLGSCIALEPKFRKQLVVSNAKTIQDEEEGRKEIKYPRISHRELVEATGGFSVSSLIGSGTFGQVYKGVLKDNTRVAVKVLYSTAREISGSFKRECQVLKTTRHRNLIRIITTCSRPDFKALVLPLMRNGSLENHLYPSHGLDLVQLVNICSDVAEGMAYLHHHSPVKGADENVSVHDSASFDSTDGLLCGSIGYIAPEYGMGKRASPQGDVYSFGVLLLEIVTGKRPTDVLFQQGSSLHEWVKNHYPSKLEPLIEEALVKYSPAQTPIPPYQSNTWRDVIVEMIELGLICTQYNPSIRPTMLDVAHDINCLKQYLSSDSSTLLIEKVPTNEGI